MAAAGDEVPRGEAGAQCHRPPGPLPRPKPSRTAMWAGRRRADTPSAVPSRPATDPGRGGSVRAWVRVPRARVLGGVCARAASFKGEQEKDARCRGGCRHLRAVGAGLRCCARVRAGRPGIAVKCLREKVGVCRHSPELLETLGRPGWNLRVIYVDAEAGDTQCACVRPSRAPFESPGFVKQPGMKRWFSSFLSSASLSW